VRFFFAAAAAFLMFVRAAARCFFVAMDRLLISPIAIAIAYLAAIL
jgi:hypothetical protein